MAELNVMSFNVCGLNIPHKRTSVLDIFHRNKVDIALIQESHLLANEITKLSNRLYQVIGYSSAPTRSRGVAIVARRNLNLRVIDQIQDTDGRIVIVKTQHLGKYIALASIYAPNSYDKVFYNTLTKMFLELSDYSFLAGADFNAVWSHGSDRTGATESYDQKQASSAMRQWALDVGVIDIWRSINPDKHDFSHLSARHKTHSRIDFIFASKNIASGIKKCSLIPMAISDHKAVYSTVSLNNRPARAAKWRLNTTLLKDEQFQKQFQEKLSDFLQINKNSVADPRIIWDATKGFIRNNAISYSSYLKKTRLHTLQQLEAQLAELDHSLQCNYNENIAIQLETVKKEINSILRSQSEFYMHRVRQNYYFNGSRPSHLLAMKL